MTRAFRDRISAEIPEEKLVAIHADSISALFPFMTKRSFKVALTEIARQPETA